MHSERLLFYHDKDNKIMARNYNDNHNYDNDYVYYIGDLNILSKAAAENILRFNYVPAWSIISLPGELIDFKNNTIEFVGANKPRWFDKFKEDVDRIIKMKVLL